MGYYSTMEGDIYFNSKLSLSKIQALFKKEKVKYSDENLADYYTIEAAGDGEFFVMPFDGEYYAKHYGINELETFISKVIEPGKHAITEFTGEDGVKYSSLIFHNEIFPIKWIPTVNGEPIENFIKKHNKTIASEKPRKEEKDHEN